MTQQRPNMFVIRLKTGSTTVLIHHFLTVKVILNAVSAISHFVLTIVKKLRQLQKTKKLLIRLVPAQPGTNTFFIARNESFLPSCLSAHIN